MANFNQSLIKLNEKHSKYVQDLKKALILGQLNFLRAGKMLYKIREEKTYEAEDAAHKWTWDDFLERRTDLPLPGSTYEGQKRNAQRLIRLYQLFIVKLTKKEEELAEIGYSKLNLIATPIEKSKEKERDNVVAEWLEKAKNLTVRDLYAEIKSENAPIGTGLECGHELERLMWVCPICGAKSSDPMNEKDNKVKIDYGKPATKPN